MTPVGDRGARIASNAEPGEVAPQLRTKSEREDGTPLAREETVTAAIKRPHALLFPSRVSVRVLLKVKMDNGYDSNNFTET